MLRPVAAMNHALSKDDAGRCPPVFSRQRAARVCDAPRKPPHAEALAAAPRPTREGAKPCAWRNARLNAATLS